MKECGEKGIFHILSRSSLNQFISLLRKKWAIPALVLVTLFLFALKSYLGISLFSSKWLDHSISYWLAAPYAELVHQAFAGGEFPFWNPFNAVGAPLATEIVNAMYSPFHWLAFLFPCWESWDLIFLVRLLVTGIGVFLFLRACEIRYWLAFHMALIYMFSGHLFYFGNAWHINSLAITPFLLLGLQQFFQQKIKVATLTVPLSWCLIIVGAGFLDAVLAVVLGGMAVCFYISSNAKKFKLNFPKESRRILYLAVLGVIGTAACGVFLIPLFELRSLSPPQWERSRALFSSFSYFISLFFHKISVTPEQGHYYMGFRQYLNILLLPGILWSILFFRQGKPLQKIWFFSFVIFSFLYLGKLFGISFLQFFSSIPLIKEIRFEKYVGTLYLCIYLWGAMGIEWMLRGKESRFFGKAIISGLCIAVLPLVYLWIYHADLTFPSIRVALIYGAVVAAFCFLLVFLKRNIRFLVFPVSLVMIISVDVDRNKHFFGAPTEIFPKKPVYSFLGEKTAFNRLRVLDINAPPKLLAPYQLFDPRDYSNSISERYYHLVRKHIFHGKIFGIFVLDSKEYSNWNHDLLSFLSTGYFVVSDMPPVNGHVKTRIPSVYFNPKAFRRAYVVYSVRYEPSPQKILGKLLEKPAYFLDHALVEMPKPPNPLVGQSHVSRGSNEVVITDYLFNQVDIEVTTDRPGILILCDQYYPGWKVMVNGKEKTIFKTNYLFRGVFLDKGKSKIHFVYRPKSFYYGLILSVLAFLALWLLGKRKMTIL